MTGVCIHLYAFCRMKFYKLPILKCWQNSYYINFVYSSLNMSLLLPVFCSNTMNYEMVYCDMLQIHKMNECDTSLDNKKNVWQTDMSESQLLQLHFLCISWIILWRHLYIRTFQGRFWSEFTSKSSSIWVQWFY